jgi:integrase
LGGAEKAPRPSATVKEDPMSIQKLPSGRYRAQVYHEGRNVSVSTVIGGPGTFATKTEAKRARACAREELRKKFATDVTLREFWDRWTTDPVFARPKESTMVQYREQTKRFVERYGDLPVAHIGDLVAAEWLAGGKRNGSVSTLRVMMNDGMSAKAGRLTLQNPFAGLGISKGKGRRDEQPPTVDMMWSLIGHARDLAGEYFAAWLVVGAHTGMRPGELDALRWVNIDFPRDRILVVEQYNALVKKFTLPKNNKRREAPLTGPAREALLALPRESEFCFVNLRGGHFTKNSRAYHWKAIAAAAGWTGDCYLATKHYTGWYMVNVLEMNSEDVAIALGHEDGGRLVRLLYGHRDKDRALDRVVAAYARSGGVTPLRRAGGGGAA